MARSFMTTVAIAFPAGVFVAFVVLCLAVESEFAPHTMAGLLLR
jgi:hypothetical protein